MPPDQRDRRADFVDERLRLSPHLSSPGFFSCRHETEQARVTPAPVSEIWSLGSGQ
jgi:hypothetical protein